MIQRIQSIYILVAGLLTAALLKMKFADLIVGDKILEFTAKGIFNEAEQVFNGLPVMLFIAAIALLHLVIIFLYKKRILQIRLLVFTIIVLLGLFGIFFYFAYMGFDNAKVAFQPSVAFPIAAAILDFLAIRAIGKDEALIRSLNRIR